jgi:hypothetical protein
MANELRLNCSGVYEDTDGQSVSLEVSNLLRTLTTKKVLRTKQTVGIVEEPLVLGDIAVRGWLILVNTDLTNYVFLKTGAGGLRVNQLFPGEPYMARLGPDMQAPYVIAITDPCEVDVFLCAV